MAFGVSGRATVKSAAWFLRFDREPQAPVSFLDTNPIAVTFSAASV
jgi:hypothetical protein